MTNSITQYLEAVRRGEPGASQALLEKVYDSLRQIAAGRLGREYDREAFQPTELVHEAWLRLGANEATGGRTDSISFLLRPKLCEGL